MINTNRGNTTFNGSLNEIEVDMTCIIKSFINLCKEELGLSEDEINSKIDDIINIAKDPIVGVNNDEQ